MTDLSESSTPESWRLTTDPLLAITHPELVNGESSPAPHDIGTEVAEIPVPWSTEAINGEPHLVEVMSTEFDWETFNKKAQGMSGTVSGMTQAELMTSVKSSEPPPRLKKVAILGFTESWKQAPFDDPTWEIWGLNELYLFIPRWTRWFELHKREVYEADKNRTDDHLGKLKAMTCPVYMHQHWDDIPSSVPYPLPAILQAFGGYLTNTISYMIALAIMEGFETIGIYGVDMAHDCLAPDMRVLTADLRWVPVGELEVGQELLAFDEEVPVHAGNGEPAQFRKYRKTRVESLSRLTRPCHEIVMGDGTRLIASVGHKWLTLGGPKHLRRWMETDKLQAQDIYPQNASNIVKVAEVWEEDRSWDAGYLAAAFDGEGHVSQGKRDNCQSSHMSVGFSQRLNGMSAEVERALVATGVSYSYMTGNEGTMKYQLKGGRSELLRFLGRVRPRRLMQKFDPDQVGTLNSIGNVAVAQSRLIGEQDVIGITTTTGTLIVEGFASHNSEYGSQRPSCEYYVGIARGRGIEVIIPDQADLMKSLFLYGYQEAESGAFFAKLKARHDELEGKMNQVNQQLAQIDSQRGQLVAAYNQYLGALQDVDHIRKIHAPSNQVTMSGSSS